MSSPTTGIIPKGGRNHALLDFLSEITTSQGIEALHKFLVPDDAYAAGWDGKREVPTKNAVYDKIQSLVIPTVTVSTYIASGTAISNVSAVSFAAQTRYVNISSLFVIMWGSIAIDAVTASTLTQVDMTLPVASNFGSADDLAGIAHQVDGVASLSMYADSGGDEARFSGAPASTANLTYSFIAGYRVI